MRFLSLFSGIEAASSAWLPLGWECAAVAEVEKFPCAVLKHHYPEVPNLGDVTKITQEQIAALGQIDLVVFGFPCQDLSVAGKRAGLQNKETGERTRSGLFYDAMRIVRWSNARWAVAENVPGLFSSEQGRDFAAVVGEMAGVGLDVPDGGWRNTGVAVGADGLVEWGVLDAQWFGIPQRRRRIFLIRDTGDWTRREPLLLVGNSLSGHPAPRREAGKGTTRGVEIGPSGGSFTETSPTLDARCKDGFIRNQLGVGAAELIPSTGDIVGPLMANTHPGAYSGQDAYTGHLIAHSLRAEGFDASEDGTGRGTPLVPTMYSIMPMNSGKDYKAREVDVAQPLMTNQVGGNQGGDFIVQPTIAFSAKDHGADSMEDCSPTLRAGGFDKSHANSGNWMAVAVRTANTGANGHGIAEDVAHTLDQAQGQAVAFNLRGREGGAMPEMDDVASLRAASGGSSRSYIAHMAVRRLVPVECERLQGFPDNYTRITDKTADGPRYKALGNSMAVPVMRWIGERIKEMEDSTAIHG